jgi:hypothetical protein
MPPTDTLALVSRQLEHTRDLLWRPVGVIVAAGVVKFPIYILIVQFIVHLPIIHVSVAMVSMVVVLAIFTVSRGSVVLLLLLKHVAGVSSAARYTGCRAIARCSQHSIPAQ